MDIGTTREIILLSVCSLGVALLYSSVGHGGGSG